MNQLSKLTMTTMALISLGVVLPGGGAFGQEKKGTTPYVTHFIFRPLLSLDVGDLGRDDSLGRGDYPKHEGREDARQDVRAMRGAERLIGRQEVH